MHEVLVPAVRLHLRPQLWLAQPAHHCHPGAFGDVIHPGRINHVDARCQRPHRGAARLLERQAKLRHALRPQVLQDLLHPLLAQHRILLRQQRLDRAELAPRLDVIEHLHQTALVNLDRHLVRHLRGRLLAALRVRLRRQRLLHFQQAFLRQHRGEVFLRDRFHRGRPRLPPADVHERVPEAFLPAHRKVELPPQLRVEPLLHLIVQQRLHPARGVHIVGLHRHGAQVRILESRHLHDHQLVNARLCQPHPCVAGPVPREHRAAIVLAPLAPVLRLAFPDAQCVLLVRARLRQPRSQVGDLRFHLGQQQSQPRAVATLQRVRRQFRLRRFGLCHRARHTFGASFRVIQTEKLQHDTPDV